MTDDPQELSRILIERFGDIFEALKGTKFGPEPKSEYTLFVGTLMKLWQHGLSALKICEQPYSQEFPEHRDYGSISVIARAALESAGTFKYAFFSVSTVDKPFLLDYMEMCGLMIRTNFEATTSEHISRLASERERIEELKHTLPKYDLYAHLSARQQRAVLEGRWKPFNKNEIPEILGFGPKSSQSIYPYLSDYTHNGYLAALQISQPNDSKHLAEGALIPISVALAFTAQTLYENFEAVRGYIDSNPDVQQAVSVFVRHGLT